MDRRYYTGPNSLDQTVYVKINVGSFIDLNFNKATFDFGVPQGSILGNFIIMATGW